MENIQRRQICYIFKMKTIHMRSSCYMDLFAIIKRMEQEFYVKNKFRGKKSLLSLCLMSFLYSGL